MKDLDTKVGEDLEKELCEECRERLRSVLTKTDVALAVFPRGLKKLYKKIGANVCEPCGQKIWNKGVGL